MTSMTAEGSRPDPRRRVSKTFTEPSQTKQAFRAGSTVDAILKKYSMLGATPNQVIDIFSAGIAQQPYGIQRAHDYQRELNQVVAVQQYFEGLPATTRDKFRNDPHAMLTWLSDAKNHDEARKLKLLPELEPTASGGATGAQPAPTAPPPPNKTGG